MRFQMLGDALLIGNHDEIPKPETLQRLVLDIKFEGMFKPMVNSLTLTLTLTLFDRDFSAYCIPTNGWNVLLSHELHIIESMET